MEHIVGLSFITFKYEALVSQPGIGLLQSEGGLSRYSHTLLFSGPFNLSLCLSFSFVIIFFCKKKLQIK
jgi:hypothetical protein